MAIGHNWGFETANQVFVNLLNKANFKKLNWHAVEQQLKGDAHWTYRHMEAAALSQPMVRTSEQGTTFIFDHAPHNQYGYEIFEFDKTGKRLKDSNHRILTADEVLNYLGLQRDKEINSSINSQRLIGDVSEKIGQQTNSPKRGITREQFIEHIDKKLSQYDRDKKLNLDDFKDAEIRNLAKLFGITEEQVKNMDKSIYRKLCIKFHPDRNPNDTKANVVIQILNKIYEYKHI